MEFRAYNELHFNTANELWSYLSPINYGRNSTIQPIYRGQMNSEWGLVPVILRNLDVYHGIFHREDIASFIFYETRLLQVFAEYCDKSGIRIPNDNKEFREKTLSPHHQDRYYKNPENWPNHELEEILAMAQHHGVPTRLLDWTTIPYVAVYFAVSSSLRDSNLWRKDDKMAIWVLQSEKISIYRNIRIIKVPGAISPNLSAQSGLFTLLLNKSKRSETVREDKLEDEFKSLPDTPLTKITIPVRQSIELYDLCKRSGIHASTIYPGYDGAGHAVNDEINAWKAETMIQNES
jgi:hypothetical protein